MKRCGYRLAFSRGAVFDVIVRQLKIVFYDTSILCPRVYTFIAHVNLFD